jgi:hypothetical protein
MLAFDAVLNAMEGLMIALLSSPLCSASSSAGRRASERSQRPPLAPVAPHQPRYAGDVVTRWSAEAWSVIRIEFRRALALRSEIRGAGWFN